MINSTQLSFFQDNGYLVIEKFESINACAEMRLELNDAVKEDSSINSNVFDSGMVHNCFMRGKAMREHLASSYLRDVTDLLLCKNAIIYAHQSSSLAPGEGNYGSRIHVDCPRFIPGYRTNLGYILALDPFTNQNGGTWVVKGSHLSENIPTTTEFENKAIQLTCNIGDAIFFDARLVHKAGVNYTKTWRHAITINFCRPYMRSRFDFPRMIDNEDWKDSLSCSTRTFLGFDVRIPTSLEEFYLPENQRLYLPNQE